MSLLWRLWSRLNNGKRSQYARWNSNSPLRRYSGGPKINYRGGRVDANAPNKAGVPLPQQDISTHTATFARQGFSQSEMIGLVACGHTFGGVQNATFPNIVQSGTKHFDASFSIFDNSMWVLHIRIRTIFHAHATAFLKL